MPSYTLGDIIVAPSLRHLPDCTSGPRNVKRRKHNSDIILAAPDDGKKIADLLRTRIFVVTLTSFAAPALFPTISLVDLFILWHNFQVCVSLHGTAPQKFTVGLRDGTVPVFRTG